MLVHYKVKSKGLESVRRAEPHILSATYLEIGLKEFSVSAAYGAVNPIGRNYEVVVVGVEFCALNVPNGDAACCVSTMVGGPLAQRNLADFRFEAKLGS